MKYWMKAPVGPKRFKFLCHGLFFAISFIDKTLIKTHSVSSKTQKYLAKLNCFGANLVRKPKWCDFYSLPNTPNGRAYPKMNSFQLRRVIESFEANCFTFF